jgi:hypothetical protein
MRRDTDFGATALRLSAGVMIWAVHFTVIYSYTGLACARRFDTWGPTWVALVPWVIGAATLLAAATTLILIVPVVQSRERTEFTRWMSACVAAFALGAILLEALPVFWVPLCG